MRHVRGIGAKASAMAVAALAALLLAGPLMAAEEQPPAIANQAAQDGAAVSNQPIAESREITWAVTEYQSSMRRDPFMSLIRSVEDVNLIAPPLQRFDVSQIRLVAVVLEIGRRYALVKLPDGTHHTIQMDDRVGVHEGVVHDIEQSKVTIRQKKYDFRHNLIDEDYEMKLREEERK